MARSNCSVVGKRIIDATSISHVSAGLGSLHRVSMLGGKLRHASVGANVDGFASGQVRLDEGDAERVPCAT